MAELAEQIESEIPSAVVALAKVSAILRSSDADELRRYFRQGGLSVFNGSPTASLMSRLSMYGHTARPCEACGGNPARWIGGSGFVASKQKPRELSPKQAALLAALDIFVPGDGLLPPAEDTVCRACEGRGWSLPKFRTSNNRGAMTVGFTARPTGSSKKGGQGSAIDVNESDMALMGKVSGRLDRVRHAQGETPAAMVLERYYSQDGGTLGAIWELTPSGKTMLRHNPQRLPPTQLWQNLRNEQSAKPTDKRRKQFETADEQAEAMLRASCVIWNEVAR